MRIVNESGLYSALFSMNPDNARHIPTEVTERRKQQLKDFKRWVTHEVLPSIRRTGSYSIQALSPAQLIAAQAQVLVDMEQKMEAMQNQTQALEAKVDAAVRVFSRPAEDHWRADMDKAIKELCAGQHLSITATKGRMYAELEETANCNVGMRLTMLRKRKRKNGMRYRDTQSLTKLDAIAADKQLRAIFEGIVRAWQAKAIKGADDEAV